MNYADIFEESINWEEFIPLTKDLGFLEKYGDKINWVNYFNHNTDMLTLPNIKLFYKYFKGEQIRRKSPMVAKDVISYVTREVPFSKELLYTENIKYLNEEVLYHREDFPYSEMLEEDAKWLNFDIISRRYRLPSVFVDRFIDEWDTEEMVRNLFNNYSLTFELFKRNRFLLVDTDGKVLREVYYNNFDFPIEYIRENIELFDKEQLLKTHNLPIWYIRELLEEDKELVQRVNFARIPTILDEEFLRELYQHGHISRCELTRYQASDSEELLIAMWDVIEESVLYSCGLVTMDFIRKHKKLINFDLLFKCIENPYYQSDLCKAREEFDLEYNKYIQRYRYKITMD